MLVGLRTRNPPKIGTFDFHCLELHTQPYSDISCNLLPNKSDSSGTFKWRDPMGGYVFLCDEKMTQRAYTKESGLREGMCVCVCVCVCVSFARRAFACEVPKSKRQSCIINVFGGTDCTSQSMCLCNPDNFMQIPSNNSCNHGVLCKVRTST